MARNKTKFKTNINSFTIAHYILLFLVVGLCIVVIAWIMIIRNGNSPHNNVSANIMHVHGKDPCVVRTIETVEKMWEYDPKSVPDRYWNMAMEYMNQTITAHFYGICQDVAFVCHPGQIRRDCDPCAVPSAREYAKQMQIADMIKTNCSPQSE